MTKKKTHNRFGFLDNFLASLNFCARPTLTYTTSVVAYDVNKSCVQIAVLIPNKILWVS